LLATAGLLNPWNLTLVDVLLNHPFFAAAVVSLVALITVVTGNRRSEARTRPMALFAWLGVLLACIAIGLAAAGTASFVALRGSWVDSLGIALAVAAALLAIVGLGSIRRHRLRWPGTIAVVPLALMFAVAVVVTPIDVAGQIWSQHLEYEQVDGLRLDWATTGGMSECSNNQFWLKTGSGVFERKLLVDSDHCGDRVTVREGGVVTVGCLKKFIVDTNTLKVISEEELHEPDCT